MELDNQSKKIVATCGTGVTACILTLAMHEVGRDDVEVYDGSWCEWGSREDVPVNSIGVKIDVYYAIKCFPRVCVCFNTIILSLTLQRQQ